MTTPTNPTDLLIVLEGPKGSKVHKLSCKRANMSLPGHSYGAKPTDEAVFSASCCKPSAALREQARQDVVSAQAVAKGNAAGEAKPATRRPLSVDTDLPPVAAGEPGGGPAAIAVTDAATLADRNKAARAEHKALKAWKDGGGKGTKPATPNLQAVVDDSEAGKTASQRVNGNGSAKGGKRREKSERRAEADKLRKAANSKRGKGIKVTDEQLAEHVANVQREHPDAHALDEMEVAYWTLGWAVTRPRFAAAWAAAAETSKGSKAS